MARRCRWVLNADVRESVRRGERIQYCPLSVRDGSSYCEIHHTRCHRPPKPREVKDVADAA